MHLLVVENEMYSASPNTIRFMRTTALCFPRMNGFGLRLWNRLLFPVNLAQCRVFHVMLKSNLAPNIGQKLLSNQWPIILGAEIYTIVK